MNMNFDWESMAGNLQDNAFGDKKSYADDVDSRFWKLSRDEDGNGGAIVRFLTDANSVPFVKIVKIRAQNANRKGFFVDDMSPQTIKLPCPFNEEFGKLWDAGEKEKAKTLGRSFRFYTNIKVIKDPANPENDGKIFLYDMSKTMVDMLKEVMVQTEAMKALDESPIAVYNPLEGNSFLIKVKNGDNGIPTYTSSKFADKVNGIYASVAEAEKDITENAYSLSEFLEPSSFKTYEELTDLLDKFLKRNKYAPKAEGEEKAMQDVEVNTGLTLGKAPVAETPVAETPAKAVEPSADVDSEIDDLLAEVG